MGGLGGAGGNIVDAGLAQCSNRWAVGLAVVDSADAFGAVREIRSVHTVNADQQNALDGPLAETILCDRSCRTRCREGEYSDCSFHYYLRDQGLLDPAG